MGIETGNFEALGGACENRTDAALLSVIARCAEVLASGKGWPEGVNDLLAALGKVTGVSRTWIFQTVKLTDTHITQNYAFEWAAQPKFKQIGMPMFSMFTNPIDRAEYRELIESRKRGEWQVVITSRIGNGWLRDSQVVQRIKSMLTIPIMVDNQWWGTLGFDDCDREYEWGEGEVALLRVASYLIANAVLQDKLDARRKQFDILKRITDSNAWSFDFRTGQLWCSQELFYSNPMPMDSLQLSLHSALRMVHPEDRKPLIDAVRGCVEETGDSLRFDVRLFNDCGGFRWVELIGNLSRDEKGRPEQLAGIAVDISRRKEEEERLQEEATTDPLTGTMNRRMFDRVLRDHVVATAVSGTPFTLLLLDIDRFKDLNDKHGHAVGDEILRHFTALCLENLRERDVIARIGGDEFAILLTGVRKDTAYNVGERIRRCVVSKPYASGTTRIYMTTSIGLAVYDNGSLSQETLIKCADMALYAAKKAGRNTLVTTTDARCKLAAAQTEEP